MDEEIRLADEYLPALNRQAGFLKDFAPKRFVKRLTKINAAAGEIISVPLRHKQHLPVPYRNAIHGWPKCQIPHGNFLPLSMYISAYDFSHRNSVAWIFTPTLIDSREQGLEPRLPDSESGVLPLDDSRILSVGAGQDDDFQRVASYH